MVYQAGYALNAVLLNGWWSSSTALTCFYLPVIIMCMHSVLIGGEKQLNFLLKAYDLGLTSGSYVFIPYDALLYSLPYTNISYFEILNNTKLRTAYDAVLTITVASDLMSFNQAFNKAKEQQELTITQDPQQVRERQIHNHASIHFLYCL